MARTGLMNGPGVSMWNTFLHFNCTKDCLKMFEKIKSKLLFIVMFQMFLSKNKRKNLMLFSLCWVVPLERINRQPFHPSCDSCPIFRKVELATWHLNKKDRS